MITIPGYENPNIEAKLESVFNRDWYTQQVDRPGEGSSEKQTETASTKERSARRRDDDGRKRLKSAETEEEKRDKESKEEKLKSLFEESAW